MTKKTPSKRLTADQRARKEKLQVIKTATPLVLTLLLLGAVYAFVLVPESPIKVLKRAMFNSFDMSKQKSWRYDGSFGDRDLGVTGEIGGQRASNGDDEIFVKLMAEDRSISYHTIKKGSDTYLLISGVDSLEKIVSKIPGAKMPDENTMMILRGINDTWVQTSGVENVFGNKLVSCTDKMPKLPTGQEYADLMGNDLPVEIVGGPYSANDGSQSRVFEVGLRKGRQSTPYESQVAELITCLDGLRGDDYRLRQISQQEVDIFKVSVTVDPLSNTVSRVLYKQFSQYAQVNIRDYNRDIVVTEPNSSKSLKEVYGSFDEPTKQAVIEKIGAELGL